VKWGARVRGGRGCARGEPGLGRGRIPGEPAAMGPAGEADAARGGSDGGDADAGDALTRSRGRRHQRVWGGAPGRGSPRRVASTRAGVRVRARARTCSPGRAASARASDLGGAAAMAPDADAPGPSRAGENAPPRASRVGRIDSVRRASTPPRAALGRPGTTRRERGPAVGVPGTGAERHAPREVASDVSRCASRAATRASSRAGPCARRRIIVPASDSSSRVAV